MPTIPVTVVETNHFATRAKKILSEAQRTGVVQMVAQDPECGVLLDGGLRKVRFALDGRGKSGGVRVIYYFYGEEVPIFLLEVFAKNEKDNLTKAELTILAQAAKAIAKSYRGAG